ncbi:MAG: hypothetical protein EOM34_09125 [Clostridia bacterium]|nr:hypothetical protein [Lachnospiraceae bacterium]NCC00827.1 hypothetical protein [Clostridia bacterium]NCD02057.1 hypothetical protein [Clostridia bacterium]
MKKFYAISMLSVCILLGLSACKKTEEPVIETSTVADKVEQSETKKKKNEYPKYVETLHESFKKITKKHYPDYSIGTINTEKSGESTFYEFNIKTTKTAYIGDATVQFYNNYKSFDVQISDELENDVIKSIIRCSLLASDTSLNGVDASALVTDISNSYDGLNKSNIVSSGDYKYYLHKTSGGILSSLMLEAVNIDDINPKVYASQYIEGTEDLFNGELNKGTEVYITGTIKNMASLEYNEAMEVETSNGIYLINYNFNKFIECFNIGDSHTFYGVVAEPREGYSGCLRLDGFE